MVKVREALPTTLSGEVNLTQWLERVAASTPDNTTGLDLPLLQAMADLSFQTGGFVLTPEYETCYKQGLHTAERLAALGADNETLAAALLYDSYRYGNREKIIFYFHSHTFYASILKLLTQLVKIDRIVDKQIKQAKYTQKNLRFLILSMTPDHRVLLIKLASHMSALRACANPLHFDTNESLRLQLSEEARYLYNPLANRLGIGQIKWELEDYSFRYLEPQAYKEIARMLDEKRSQREITIEEIKVILKNALDTQKIQASISGRAKHIYSIFRKMTRKHVDFKEIYDVYAIRIIVPTIEACYAALGIVQGLWQSIGKEFDDYIMTPKKNGYRSLHTAVIGPQGRSLEIQIRTEEMHQKAELGVAAHWIYKENDPNLAASSDCTNVSFKKIYILSPQGDIIALASGATPLDFAYHIHTELGHRCRGAKVNGKMVSLTYALQSCDEVEIISVKIGGPSRDWTNKHLGYLNTAHAISKVNAWFRRQETLDLDKDHKEEKKEIIKEVLKTEFNDLTALKTLAKTSKAHNGYDAHCDIKIAGMDNLLCHYAKCCKPVPGDSIIGYITHGHGVTVHREDCLQMSTQSIENNRLIQVDWEAYSNNKTYYPVDMVIISDDKQQILQNITALFSQEKLKVTALHTTLDDNNNTAIINLTFEISDLNYLQNIILKIKRLPRIIKAQRV